MVLFYIFPFLLVLNSVLGQSNEINENERIYSKAHSYLILSKAFKNYTLEDTKRLVDQISSWEAPRELQDKFPYYHSGYDEQDRPVWIAEVGKFNVPEQIRKGPEGAHNATQYLFQAVLRIGKSILAKDTPTKEIRHVVGILDWEGFEFQQALHIPTIHFALNLLHTYHDFLDFGLGHAVMINSNHVTKTGFESIRPALGDAFRRLEFYDSNKAKWMEALRKLFPLSAIPTWYGGSKDYKPIQVFG